MRRRGWTIGKTRRLLYGSARVLGDVQAISSGDPVKVEKRIARRLLGRVFARLLSRLI